jgi:hypothetical protein
MPPFPSSANCEPTARSTSHHKYALTRGALGATLPHAITMPMGSSAMTAGFGFFIVPPVDNRSACGENGRRKPMSSTVPLCRPPNAAWVPPGHG